MGRHQIFHLDERLWEEATDWLGDKPGWVAALLNRVVEAMETIWAALGRRLDVAAAPYPDHVSSPALIGAA